MRAAFAILVMISLGAFFVSCRGSGEAAREEFVHQFVRSAFADSPVYKQYVSEQDRQLIDAARPRMTEEFEIIHRDEYGGGNYEYGVRFANGATAVVAVYEKEGRVEMATLAINDQPRKE
jgi:hypothetical protein